MSSKICKIIPFLGSFFDKRTYKKEIFKSFFFSQISSIGCGWAYFDKKCRKLSGHNTDVQFPLGIGVILTNNAIVGAGSVATKGFEEGNRVICGN